MTIPSGDLAARIQRIEDTLAIKQLPVRYAQALDERDIDTWVELFVEDVAVGPHSSGREALRAVIVPAVQKFYRSVHYVAGHRVDLVDESTAVGSVYCRAEHEVGDRWVVMAIRYADQYRKVDGQWLFARRREDHWYAADLPDRPQSVGFDDWDAIPAPKLPRRFPQWEPFWHSIRTTSITDRPIDPAE